MRKATQLRHHPHSPESKTDVWAFGVLLWEIMTLAFVPYNTIGDDEAVAEAVIAGRRLPKPEACSDDMYSIMLSCWAKQPRDRPDMPEVHIKLQEAFVEACAKTGNECVICMAAEAVVAMIPCGHRCLCESCLKLDLPQCPMCRQPVADARRIYG